MFTLHLHCIAWFFWKTTHFKCNFLIIFPQIQPLNCILTFNKVFFRRPFFFLFLLRLWTDIVIDSHNRCRTSRCSQAYQQGSWWYGICVLKSPSGRRVFECHGKKRPETFLYVPSPHILFQRTYCTYFAKLTNIKTCITIKVRSELKMQMAKKIIFTVLPCAWNNLKWAMINTLQTPLHNTVSIC